MDLTKEELALILKCMRAHVAYRRSLDLSVSDSLLELQAKLDIARSLRIRADKRKVAMAADADDT